MDFTFPARVNAALAQPEDFPVYRADAHRHGDMVDCLAEVTREWRRDNGFPLHVRL